MNINDLTIGQAKELAAMFGNKSDATPIDNGMIGKYVIVRCRDAGVHAGAVSKLDRELEPSSSVPPPPTTRLRSEVEKMCDDTFPDDLYHAVIAAENRLNALITSARNGGFNVSVMSPRNPAKDVVSVCIWEKDKPKRKRATSQQQMSTKLRRGVGLGIDRPRNM